MRFIYIGRTETSLVRLRIIGKVKKSYQMMSTTIQRKVLTNSSCYVINDLYDSWQTVQDCLDIDDEMTKLRNYPNIEGKKDYRWKYRKIEILRVRPHKNIIEGYRFM